MKAVWLVFMLGAEHGVVVAGGADARTIQHPACHNPELIVKQAAS
jgi:hypothetical protein